MVVTSGHVVGVRLQKSSTNPLGCKIVTKTKQQEEDLYSYISWIYLKRKRDDNGNQNRWLTIQAELE